MEQLQGLLRNKVGQKRYLLILDDVWNEKREEWLKLMTLLKNGRKGKLISSFRCLRVLDLHNIEVKSLPNSVDKLIHLRYLNLSNAPIRQLPDSLTKLLHLQTLKLHCCQRLRALPKNLRTLNNLRSLDVGECYNLMYMPSGLGKLTSLSKLPRFIVNHRQSPISKSKPDYAKLSDLKNLNNLRGDLHIEIGGEIKDPLFEATETNLFSKRGLTKLCIGKTPMFYDDVNGISHNEAVFEGLKPHPNLKKLEIHWYRGQKLPSWTMNNLCIHLPKLVAVKLDHCGWCQQVPLFGQLPFLKRLDLVHLESVEYMETESSLDDLSLLSDSSMTQQSFFPSLQELTLMNMDNLEGWWKVGADANDTAKEASHQLNEQRPLSMSFSKLSKMWIQECPKLVLLPLCPNMIELTLVDVSKAISVSKMAASTSTSESDLKLKKLTISNVQDLISLPRERLPQLSKVEIQEGNLVSTNGIGINEVFTSLSSSLHTLEFTHCASLMFLGQGVEHLTALEKLVLWNCEQLDLSVNEQMPWKNFKNLRQLIIHNIPKLFTLPSGLQHLANLHSLEMTCNYELKEVPEWISCFSSLGYLELYRCPKLTSLPDGLRKLTSLNQLMIIECPELTARCRAPNGRDWPKIQHIPFAFVQDNL
ncbi:putative disease resistance protein RGA3 [Bienertia sinuspersici]